MWFNSNPASVSHLTFALLLGGQQLSTVQLWFHIDPDGENLHIRDADSRRAHVLKGEFTKL